MARRKLSHESIQQAAQKWANGYAQSGNAIKAGVQNPSRDPTQAAIAAQQTLLANLTAAITSGRWAQGLQQSGLQGWQQGMLNKTIPSLATRAQVGQGHYAAFLQQWIPPLQSFIQTLPPRADYATNKSRMNAVLDYMHGQRGKFRRAWRNQGANFFGGASSFGPSLSAPGVQA